jgi:hypothetical protein
MSIATGLLRIAPMRYGGTGRSRTRTAHLLELAKQETKRRERMKKLASFVSRYAALFCDASGRGRSLVRTPTPPRHSPGPAFSIRKTLRRVRIVRRVSFPRAPFACSESTAVSESVARNRRPTR